MNFTFAFTNAGTPATGLSPIINVWDLTGSLMVDAQPMTELVGGFYTYNFTGYNSTVEYIIQGYESSLPIEEQYVSGSNDVDTIMDHERILQILGLVQSNYRMTNTIYDTDGNLTSATIKTYLTSANMAGNTDPIATYGMTAVYASGVLVDYRMGQVA